MSDNEETQALPTDANTQEAANGVAEVVNENVSEEENGQPEGKSEGGEKKGKYVPVEVFYKRVNGLSAKQRQLAEENETLKQLLAAKKEGGEDGNAASDKPKGMSYEEYYRQQRAAEAYNERANHIYSEGVKQFDNFDGALQDLGAAGLDNAHLQELVEFDNAAHMVVALADDLNRFDEILSMSPARRAIALAKLSAKLEIQAEKPKVEHKPTTKAPAPHKPIQAGSGAAEIDTSKISFADYAKLKGAKR